MVRVRQDGLLLGEWACLAALGQGRLHGFAVAKRLAPDGDLGRVWTLSRPLTYRAITTLTDHGLVKPVTEEPGNGGPTRTVVGLTPKGRTALKRWLDEPVVHPRDVRSELLLKIVVRQQMGLARDPLVSAQIALFERHVASRATELASDPGDPVRIWRVEFAEAAVRFVRSVADLS